MTGNVNCPADVKVKLQENSNERLEFLGDAVLSLVVADYLFERLVPPVRRTGVDRIEGRPSTAM